MFKPEKFEFKESVLLPELGSDISAYVEKFTSVTREECGYVFRIGDRAIAVPESNIRCILGRWEAPQPIASHKSNRK